MRFEPLLRPRSIAVVGASPDRGKIGGRVLQALRTYGFPGQLYGVNPRYEDIAGVPCVPSVRALPEAVDLVVVAVPATVTVAVVQECADRGVGAVSIMSSGFAESDQEGVRRQDKLVKIATDAGIALLGPNADGILNVRLGLAAAFATAVETPGLRPGPLSLITQSGAFGSFAVALARQRSVGLNYWLSTGNAAVLKIPDLARALLDDRETRVLGIYLEGLADARQLTEVAEQYLAGSRPVVVLKGGATEAGRQAAMTHTGSMVGSAAVWDGALRRSGVVSVDSLAEFFDVTAGFSALDGPVGPCIAVVTSSGAAGVLASDAASRSGLRLARLSAPTVERLAEVLPFGVSGMPLDLAGVLGQPGLTERVVTILGQDTEVDGIVLLTGAREGQADRLHQELVTARDRSATPLVISWTACPAQAEQSFWESGIPCYADASAAIAVLAKITAYWSNRSQVQESIVGRPAPRPAVIDGSSPTGQMLGERASKAMLARHGVAVPDGALARDADEAVVVAERIGYPLAMKIESPDVVHKTDAGGVVLDICDAAQARAAFGTITDRVVASVPGARVSGVYVERMAEVGVELLAGVTRDPQFGLCLAIGLGGIFAEALQDVSVRPLPVSRIDIQQMLGSLRGAALLRGYRGRKVDLIAVEEAVLAIAAFADFLADGLESLDVNPLLATASGAVALDARIQLTATNGAR